MFIDLEKGRVNHTGRTGTAVTLTCYKYRSLLVKLLAIIKLSILFIFNSLTADQLNAVQVKNLCVVRCW